MRLRETPELIRALQAIRPSLAPSYIEHIRFPRFRNLAADTRITFDFPMTILIGRNGTNKSSVLQALAGSVQGRSPEDHWFETSVDPITYEVNGLRSSVIHGYRCGPDNGIAEVLKTRFRREGNPDYWEAAKPIQKYGMDPSSGRTSPIAMEVVYLDFRAELSAFDKAFYFPEAGRLRRADKYRQKHRRKGARSRRYTKQDYIRSRSRSLRRLLDKLAAGESIAGAREFSPIEIDWLRWLMEKPYVGGTVVAHDYYGGSQGRSIVLRTTDLQQGYSEAFAGSGEFAAASLVLDVLNAKDHSLILLDEPETSLHPTAQTRLRDFLLEQALRKKLQVVLSTHSPRFVDGMPEDAIKIFDASDGGPVLVRNRATPREAFFEVSPPAPGRLLVVVEDPAAKILVEATLREVAPASLNSIRLEVRPGGASAIFRDVVGFARERRTDVVALLDGDKKPVQELQLPSKLPLEVVQSRSALAALVKAFCGQDGLVGADAAEAFELLEFLYRHVGFLPGDYPEQLVFRVAWLADYLARGGADESKAVELATCSCGGKCVCFKQKYHVVASMVGGAATAEVAYRDAVTSFIRSNEPMALVLKDAVPLIRSGRVRPG